MKLRQGFVSNSSSSSFIIGILEDKPKACPHCGRGGRTDIIKTITGYRDYDTSVDWEDIDYRIEEIELEQKDDVKCGYGRDEYLDEELEVLEKAKGEFKQVYGLSVSYHDELALYLLDEMDKSGEIKILMSGD